MSVYLFIYLITYSFLLFIYDFRPIFIHPSTVGKTTTTKLICLTFCFSFFPSSNHIYGLVKTLHFDLILIC